MKFHLILCPLHGWGIYDAEPPVRKSKREHLQCRGGHRITANTSDLPIYEADPKHIPDKIGLSDEEKKELVGRSRRVGSN